MNSIRRLARLAAMYAFQVFFVRPMLRWYWGAHFRRRHHVPGGPCIVVANHNSHLDAALLMTMFPMRRLPHVHPVAAADYFGKTAWRQWVAAIWMNAMAIERTTAPGRDVLSPMIDALRDGESLIFFPEGSRGEPGVVARFRPGIGKIVRSVPGVLVVPVFVSGAERSLPRGVSVPLPLGIDVFIGKPRTFSPHLDAHEIADEIRDDVLALAPPAPPPPGRRSAPPVRVAFCGIDDEVNGRLCVALTERLGSSGRTIGLGATAIESDGSGLREASRIPLSRSRAWPRALGWVFRTGGLYRGKKFAEMVERARVEEALQGAALARFVVSTGSPLVDLLAWAEADFYSGVFDEKGLQQILLFLSGQRRLPRREWIRFIRRAPEVWLLGVFGLAHPLMPDLLVLTRRSPEGQMEGLRAAGGELEGWQHETFLARLQDAYGQVAAILRRRRVEVIDLTAEDLDVSSSLERIEEACRRLALKGMESPAET